MNWEAIGAVGELIGAAAVVLTLVYLSLQMRQNTLMLRSQSRRQVLEGLTTDTERVLLNPHLKAIWKKYLRDEVLSEDEEFDMFALFQSFLGNLEIQYHEVLDKSLEPIFEDTLRFRLLTILDDKGRIYWQQTRSYFTKPFQEYVDELITLEGEKASEAKASISFTTEGDV